MNGIVKIYTDARDKMKGMKLSETYSEAKEEYVKGLDSAIAGYSALLKTDSTYIHGAYTSAETAVKQINTAEINFDKAKKMMDIDGI